LGSRYALLREEFLKWRAWQRVISPVGRKVLVTLGGSDPDNVTRTVVEALARVDIEGLETVILVGGLNPHLADLRETTKQLRSPARLLLAVPDMPELMAWADVAVSASGSTSWELAFMGLPSIMIVLAENQAGIAAALEREGVNLNLGEHTQISVERIIASLQSLLPDTARRSGMSQHGRNLVDGLGAERIVCLLTRNKIEDSTSHAFMH
jgi:spore coat polysaccharide biosynthesis predicted glycosyltransferase SpsG